MINLISTCHDVLRYSIGDRLVIDWYSDIFTGTSLTNSSCRKKYRSQWPLSRKFNEKAQHELE